MSDQWRATFAPGDVGVERHAVVPRHGLVEVIAESRFDLFTSPDHFRSLLLSSLVCFVASLLHYFFTSLLYVESVPQDGLTPICCKILANSIRPRLILDFTVPSGTDKTRCISMYSNCCKSRKMTASRNSGESLVSAVWTCELSSLSRSCWSGLRPADSLFSTTGMASSSESVIRSRLVRR